MASAANDSDVELGSENESENEGTEHGAMAQVESQPLGNEQRSDPTENPRRRPQSAETRRRSERTEHIVETRTEAIQGLDDLTTCINSVDDHFQAGLQELRNCVANLKRERTEMSQRLRTLSEEVFHVSTERDRCQLAVVELQQEVASLRDQLCSQQQDKESLLQRMQAMQQQNEDHLVKIAGRQRSRRLAHSAIVRWRRKALDKKLSFRDQLSLLEEENNELRAELLLCQEAAKQAFLRSANVLNSEALSMFQDAATRRLGFEETPPQGSQTSHDSSPSISPVPQAHASQEDENVAMGAVGEDKENIERYREFRNIRGTSRDRVGDARDRRSFEVISGNGDERAASDSHGSVDHFAGYRGNCQPTSLHHRPQFYHGDREASGVHVGDQSSHRSSGFGNVGPHLYNPAFGDYSAEGGRVPQQPGQNSPTVGFDPNALRQESRAHLQRLRDDGRWGPEPPLASRFESHRKAQKTLASHRDPKRKACGCGSSKRENVPDTQIPYKCPYCTPVQNSSFGHAKDGKKPSNVVRANILTGKNADKKTLYKPSASTIVIEKHITR